MYTKILRGLELARKEICSDTIALTRIAFALFCSLLGLSLCCLPSRFCLPVGMLACGNLPVTMVKFQVWVPAKTIFLELLLANYQGLFPVHRHIRNAKLAHCIVSLIDAFFTYHWNGHLEFGSTWGSNNVQASFLLFCLLACCLCNHTLFSHYLSIMKFQ